MKKFHTILVVGILLSTVFFVLFLNYYDFFTPITKENTFGIKASVREWPPSWVCPNVCPKYEISLGADKDVAITEVYVCKVLCVKQNGVVLDTVKMTYTNMAIQSSLVPWQAGDDVDIRLKVAPVHMDGGLGYSDYETKMLDLGSSVVKTS